MIGYALGKRKGKKKAMKGMAKERSTKRALDAQRAVLLCKRSMVIQSAKKKLKLSLARWLKKLKKFLILDLIIE